MPNTIIETTNLRVRVEQDELASPPDNDGSAFVFARYCTGTELVQCDYGQEVPLDILHAVQHEQDIETLRAHLEAEHDVVSFAHWAPDWNTRFIAITTQALAASWGFPLEGQTPEQQEIVRRSAADALLDWERYVTGDVYYFVVEEKVRWLREGAKENEWRDTWELVESCGGFYGYEYAKEAAIVEFSAIAADRSIEVPA